MSPHRASQGGPEVPYRPSNYRSPRPVIALTPKQVSCDEATFKSEWVAFDGGDGHRQAVTFTRRRSTTKCCAIHRAGEIRASFILAAIIKDLERRKVSSARAHLSPASRVWRNVGGLEEPFAGIRCVECRVERVGAGGDRGLAWGGVSDGSAALSAAERVGVRDVLPLRSGEDVSGVDAHAERVVALMHPHGPRIAHGAEWLREFPREDVRAYDALRVVVLVPELPVSAAVRRAQPPPT